MYVCLYLGSKKVCVDQLHLFACLYNKELFMSVDDHENNRK